MSKKSFVSKEKLDEIAAQYATPFYLYDEAAIRETARRVNKAFAWNQGFKEYFAVKATPNPAILKILHEEGCGADCSSYTELQMADAVGFKGDEIMFSSNATPAEDFQLARQLISTFWKKLLISRIRSAAVTIQAGILPLPTILWIIPVTPNMV